MWWDPNLTKKANLSQLTSNISNYVDTFLSRLDSIRETMVIIATSSTFIVDELRKLNTKLETTLSTEVVHTLRENNVVLAEEIVELKKKLNETLDKSVE